MPGNGIGYDNLYLFTRYDITDIYNADSSTGIISNFNFGGARVELPSGQGLNLFPLWTSYTDPWIGYMINDNANDIAKGLEPRHSVEAVESADRVQVAQNREIIRQIEALVGETDEAILAGGDLNTVSASDWSVENADIPSHHGQSFDFEATDLWERAGYRDVYRTANPDVAAAAGSTWSPHEPQNLVPQRIDFTFARGEGIDVLSAWNVDTRLPQHGDGLFYSDHAAVVADLRIGSQPAPVPLPAGGLLLASALAMGLATRRLGARRA
ncbi:endonuclease/exonuclease/phosphatase family protein [Paracoccus sp. S3-43]|uniref:endonuclease/exonuclease/phosphatase family protein n=1 Tax=Paracoccus sp. S3-43 TaxID=3030011 RepID=UPI0023AFF0A2|nr:endonuclease/exonuclease/phosphatase family protein [Paracoccus sp. S3-43]WEF23892.1 endonuclease/exonuclease/phosphatase family protein [Paracoccus sp. S3-43]